jgi:acetyltransferase-like isoleucine patch superfamily enzyme
MHLGLRKLIRNLRTRYHVLWMNVLYRFFGLESVVVSLRTLDKESVEAVLRKFGAQIGQNCDVESGITLHNAEVDFSNLSIGSLCHIGKEVFLDLRAPIIIHDQSTISMRTVILTHTDVGHAGPFAENDSPHARRVEIGSGAYIGAGVTILPGVKVGEVSIIGAGSVVNKDVAPRTGVAGVPAKEFRKIEM